MDPLSFLPLSFFTQTHFLPHPLFALLPGERGLGCSFPGKALIIFGLKAELMNRKKQREEIVHAIISSLYLFLSYFIPEGKCVYFLGEGG